MSIAVNERQRDAERKRAFRAASRDLTIPKCASWSRRRAAERDVFRWLRKYLPHVFYGPFTDQRREMVTAILNAAKYGGDQAIAAPRGDGKTSLAEGVVLYCILLAILRFPVILAATGPDAERILAHLKEELEENALLLADYPEVCVPIRDVAGAPNRAQAQTVGGKRTRLKWTGKWIRLPFVANSRCSGSIIATRGLDAAVRGIKIGSKRPDLAVFDDPDTADTAANEEQGEKLEKKIDRDVAGLAGPDRTLARVLLTTVQTRRCVSYKYTDPMQKPSFNGKRFRLLIAEPTRSDLWEEYVAMRQHGMQTGDLYGRQAHAFYLLNRAEMDAGAAVGNPNRFDGTILPDGTPKQVSTLQFCFDFIADKGRTAFDTEFQNHPPEETQLQESGITPHRVQKQVSGFPRKTIPPGCTVLSQGIDCHKTRLYWTVRAWKPEADGGASCFTIDYGITEVFGTTYGSDAGVDEALIRALHERKQQIEATPYADEDGRPMAVGMTLVDAGWQTQAVYRFCDEAGLGYYPSLGYGRSSGTIRPNFYEPTAGAPNKVMGWRYFSAPRADGGWCVHMDADHFKQWEHSRWMSDPHKPAGMLLFGFESPDPARLSQDQRGHHAYAHHICAEVEVEEPIKGILKRYWKAKNDNNHWLDASYRATVAGALAGVFLFGMPQYVEEPQSNQHEGGRGVTALDGSPYFVMDRR